MNQKVLILIAVLLATIFTYTNATSLQIDYETASAEYPSALVLWKIDGTSETLCLDEQLTTILSDGCLTVSTNTFSVSYSENEVIKYTFDYPTSGISTLQSGGIIISKNGDLLMIENINLNCPVSVYSTDGLLMSYIMAVDHDNFNISIRSYPKGMYLVHIGGKVYKIYKN